MPSTEHRTDLLAVNGKPVGMHIETSRLKVLIESRNEIGKPKFVCLFVCLFVVSDHYIEDTDGEGNDARKKKKPAIPFLFIIQPKPFGDMPFSILPEFWGTCQRCIYIELFQLRYL